MSGIRPKVVLFALISLYRCGLCLPACDRTPTSAAPAGSAGDPSALSAEATVSSSAAVAPPSYILTFDSFQLVVDAQAVVQSSSSGIAILRRVSGQAQPGEEWKLFGSLPSCCQTSSFSAIDALYQTEAPIGKGRIEGPADVEIPWSAFGLLNQHLPAARVLLIKHSGDGGLAAYALFDVRFPGPQ